jgi:exopolyphosphatase/guanosine-5'-triphosphate,3'-diphosphate pyrophosphatase
MARYAAIDIGSNSVRMLAAEASPGMAPKRLEEGREVTRLGTSVFAGGRISDQAILDVCAVLRRMAAAYSKLDVAAVRAVATSAVRDASNQDQFLERASEALGSPVEVISGQEEARLIFLGVQSRWDDLPERTLIMDVGGGSAEFITAAGGEMKDGISRPLGAVRLTEVFLKHDPPTTVELNRMEQFIDDKFEPVQQRIPPGRFDRMIATSATAAAIVSAIHRVPRSERDAADRLKATTVQIRKLYRDLASRPLEARKHVSGIGPRRAEIIVAGIAAFLRVMETLKVESLQYSAAGVRDGIVADLAARRGGEEATRLTRQQLRVVEMMCRKYSVDNANARQVARFSSELFHATRPLHRLPPDRGRLLQTAAWLREAGHFISDTGHHKHSAYIVSNSDMPGYTDVERLLVALLCRYHRKSMPQPRHEPYKDLSPEHKRTISMLTPLLRLGVALDTSGQQKIGIIDCNLHSGGATLRLTGEGDLDLEVWAAERAADVFRQVYNVPMTVERA